MTKSISIKDRGGETEGHLLPVTFLDLGDKRAIQLLMNWRNEHSYAYPLRTPVTFESTKNWLQGSVLNNDKRILFWVLDTNGNKIGHVGLAWNENGNIELDNILRGELSSLKGLMSKSIRSLEFFLETEFQIMDVYLKVLKSNQHATNFYRKLQYVDFDIIDLKSETINGITRLIPGQPAQDQYIVMKKNLLQARNAPKKILTAGPIVSSYENFFVLDAVANGWNEHHSDYIKRFEAEFSTYIDCRFAIATSSCTGALHLALLALGIGPGDEVIVPELTWVASASAVRYVGATPVFADINPDSWTISTGSLCDLINKKTKAIIPVHLYGYPANMDQIVKIANENGVRIIEDAAPAVGAKYDNKFVGTFGDFGCFSFQGAKMLVTGEGGMLVTNNEDLFQKAWKLQDHGRRAGTFWIDEVGMKYKISNLQAAFGLGQLKRVENQIEKKRMINRWYQEDLNDLDCVKFQQEDPKSNSICWMTSIEIDVNAGVNRDYVMKSLLEQGIDTRPVFPAISQYPIWDRKFKAQPIAQKIGNNSINLPSGVLLARKSVSKVSQAIRIALENN